MGKGGPASPENAMVDKLLDNSPYRSGRWRGFHARLEELKLEFLDMGKTQERNFLDYWQFCEQDQVNIKTSFQRGTLFDGRSNNLTWGFVCTIDVLLFTEEAYLHLEELSID